MPRPPRPLDDDEDPVQAAWAAGMRMIARRELSVAQVRDRLARRGLPADAVEQAVTRLVASGALDDVRVALACARTRSSVKRQGRDRVQRELQALGIARDTARAAVDEVFGAVDESALLEEALTRRLRARLPLTDPGVQRRLWAALVRQGFDGQAVSRAIRARAKASRDDG